MEDFIEYQGSPEEWRKINSKHVPHYSTAKRKRKPFQKLYRLTYGNETIVPSATFEKCVARREQLKNQNPNNYKLQTFKITENVRLTNQ
jgi:hypothetical protein